MKNAAIIVSAGSTSGTRHLNPTQMIGSISVTKRLISTLHLAGVDSICIVVSVEDEENLLDFAGRNGVELLREVASKADRFENVRLALAKLQGQCERVLITPVDIPLFSVATVQTLLGCGQALAVPVCEGRAGHPLLVEHTVIPSILRYQGSEGLRGAVRECGFERVSVEVDDVGVYVRSDQFEECEKIAVTHNRDMWTPVMKLQIAKESAFLGPGSWHLLSLIEATGSVRLACEQIGLSYSKAWKILNNLEDQVGFRVLVRKHGGKNGGVTYLTEEGKQLLERFERFERACNKEVSRLFEQYFGVE